MPVGRLRLSMLIVREMDDEASDVMGVEAADLVARVARVQRRGCQLREVGTASTRSLRKELKVTW